MPDTGLNSVMADLSLVRQNTDGETYQLVDRVVGSKYMEIPGLNALKFNTNGSSHHSFRTQRGLIEDGAAITELNIIGSPSSDHRRITGPLATENINSIELNIDDLGNPRPYPVEEYSTEKLAKIRIFNSKQRIVYQSSNFVLQQVQRQESENFQVNENFGQWISAFFFGNRPKVRKYTGSLVDTVDVAWKSEFVQVYESYFRGTKLIENQFRAYLSYKNTVVEGFPIDMNVIEDSTNDNVVTFSFTMLIVNESTIGATLDINPEGTGVVKAPNGTSLSIIQSWQEAMEKSLITQNTKREMKSGERLAQSPILKAEGYEGDYNPREIPISDDAIFNPTGAPEIRTKYNTYNFDEDEKMIYQYYLMKAAFDGVANLMNREMMSFFYSKFPSVPLIPADMWAHERDLDVPGLPDTPTTDFEREAKLITPTKRTVQGFNTNEPIKTTVLHHTGSGLGAKRICEIWQAGANPTNGMLGAHFIVGARGTTTGANINDIRIWQCVDLRDVARHCGFNSHSIGIEMDVSVGEKDPDPGPRWTNATTTKVVEISAKLAAALKAVFGTASPYKVPAYVNGISHGQMGFAHHKDYNPDRAKNPDLSGLKIDPNWPYDVSQYFYSVVHNELTRIKERLDKYIAQQTQIAQEEYDEGYKATKDKAAADASQADFNAEMQKKWSSDYLSGNALDLTRGLFD